MHVTDAQLHDLSCDTETGIWSCTVVLIAGDANCVFRAAVQAEIEAPLYQVERLLVADAIRQAARMPEVRSGARSVTRATRVNIQIMRNAA